MSSKPVNTPIGKFVKETEHTDADSSVSFYPFPKYVGLRMVSKISNTFETEFTWQKKEV